MKWKKPTYKPKLGDQRERTKFAWLPVTVVDLEGNEYTAWLETYSQTQVFTYDTVGLKEYVYLWKPVKNNALFYEHEI